MTDPPHTPNITDLIHKDIKTAYTLINNIPKVEKLQKSTNKLINKLVNSNRQREAHNHSTKNDLIAKMKICLEYLTADISHNLFNTPVSHYQTNKQRDILASKVKKLGEDAKKILS